MLTDVPGGIAHEPYLIGEPCEIRGDRAICPQARRMPVKNVSARSTDSIDEITYFLPRMPSERVAFQALSKTEDYTDQEWLF